MTPNDLATIAAELAVIAEGTDRYRVRVADLARRDLGDHDDLVGAMHEAERALRSAHRALARATRLVD